MTGMIQMKSGVSTRLKSHAEKFSTDDARWEAVMRRDPDADGAFLYSVATTGVYCRPTCGSRRALRENVRFHPSCEAAERAGFRPCRRCRPDGPGRLKDQAEIIAAACRALETGDDAPDLENLARMAGMSRFHFHRVFKQTTGVTPKAYAIACRAERMRRVLPESRTVTEAIYRAGFNSNGRFYEESSGMLGMAPQHFREGGKGEVIRFASGKSSLGFVLVASSAKGVCAILLGDDPSILAEELRRRFPSATLKTGGGDFQQTIRRVVALVEAPGIGLDLPLDVRGTAFQQRVWAALREIPPGSTTSYSALAKRIGQPRAVRAVAGACAANAIAVAIPCHRVVRTGGGLSGYRWGAERKRVLIQREADASSGAASTARSNARKA